MILLNWWWRILVTDERTIANHKTYTRWSPSTGGGESGKMARGTIASHKTYTRWSPSANGGESG